MRTWKTEMCSRVIWSLACGLAVCAAYLSTTSANAELAAVGGSLPDCTAHVIFPYCGPQLGKTCDSTYAACDTLEFEFNTYACTSGAGGLSTTCFQDLGNCVNTNDALIDPRRCKTP
jgi:hypothetical protein